MTQDAFFSLLTLTKQLLLVTFYHTTAENGANFRTHERTETETETETDGWTDRRGSRNSYLDIQKVPAQQILTLCVATHNCSGTDRD